MRQHTITEEMSYTLSAGWREIALALSRQEMRDRKSEAGRLCPHGGQRIAVRKNRSSRRTDYRPLQIRCHISLGYRRIRALFQFQCPLLNGRIDLPKVIDAGILNGGRPRLDKVRNGDRGEQTNNAYHNHDFHQREPRGPSCFP